LFFPLPANVLAIQKKERGDSCTIYSLLKFTIMEMIGRVTADAKVSEVKDGKKVVNFGIAINDSHKPKDSDERVQVTTYVQCDYWISESIAPYLTKGTLVELSGRIGVEAWNNMDGEARATLRLHVQTIKLHGKPNRVATDSKPQSIPGETDIPDDLPF
jgi:single-strand DNA-binding protein